MATGQRAATEPVVVTWSFRADEPAAANRGWAWVMIRPYWWSIMAAIVLATFGWVIAAGGRLLVVVITLAFVGLVELVMTGVLQVAFAMLAKWRVRRSGLFAPDDEIRYVFDVDSVTLDSRPVTQRLAWDLVSGCVLWGDFIYLKVGRRSAMWLPVRAVGPDQFAAIVRLMPRDLPVRRFRPIALSEDLQTSRAE